MFASTCKLGVRVKLRADLKFRYVVALIVVRGGPYPAFRTAGVSGKGSVIMPLRSLRWIVSIMCCRPRYDRGCVYLAIPVTLTKWLSFYPS